MLAVDCHKKTLVKATTFIVRVHKHSAVYWKTVPFPLQCVHSARATHSFPQ